MLSILGVAVALAAVPSVSAWAACSYHKDQTDLLLSTPEGVATLRGLKNKSLTLWGYTADSWYRHHEELVDTLNCRKLNIDYDARSWTLSYRKADNAVAIHRGKLELITNDATKGNYFTAWQTSGPVDKYVMGISSNDYNVTWSILYLSDTDLVLRSCRSFFWISTEPEYVYSSADLAGVDETCFTDTLTYTLGFPSTDGANAKKIQPGC